MIKINSIEALELFVEALEKRERELQLKLARVRIMIDACEREDYSDLSPSMLRELEELRKDEPQANAS